MIDEKTPLGIVTITGITRDETNTSGGDCSVWKCGHLVQVNVFAIMSSSASETWHGYRIFSGLPKAVAESQRTPTITVDNYTGNNPPFCAVNTSGELFLQIRSEAMTGKTIIGGFTYMCSD